MASKSQSASETPVSARQLLIDWANEQDGWARQLVSEVLSSSEELSDDVLDAVFDQYLHEKSLADGDTAEVDKLDLAQPSGVQSAEFKINSLSDISGVNALVKDQTIEFNDRLTILFGENGSGKTGYTRILKLLGAVRTAEPIIPNVHEPANDAKPHAAIKYTLNGKAETLAWDGEEGLAPFTHTAIFDSPAVRLHVDDELAYVYTPGDLALFPRVTNGINEIKARLETAVSEKQPATNPYLPHFTRGTPVYPVIETLGATTDPNKISELAGVTDKQEARQKDLASQIKALQSGALAAQVAVARSTEELNNSLVTTARTIQTFDSKAYNEAIDKAKKADAEYAKLRGELLTVAGLADKGEAQWQAFILSGEEYREHLDHEYPKEGDTCLYCRQVLEQPAVALIKRYHEFAQDANRQAATDARDLATTLSRDLFALNVTSLRESLTKAQANEEDAASGLGDASEMLSELDEKLPILREHKAIDWNTVSDIAKKVEKVAQTRYDTAKNLVKTLTEKEAEREETLKKATAEHAAIKDRQELKRHLSGIEKHVQDAKWAQQGSELLKRFQGVLRSLTGVSKVASQEMLNTDFEERFEKESAALRAPQVKLDFPGREGKAARRKTVSDSYRPSQILSEGEQKVIALADFFAEAGLRLTKAPVILDDPVNSLDYRRIHEVTDRVTALVRDRQVIVFTHNIWFAAELLSKFENERDQCSYFNVTDEEPGKGFIASGIHPRWDTINKTRSKINEVIQAAQSNEGETREALIERGYSLIRAWCEVAVEMELLAGVVTRYKPNIGMTQLSKIKIDRVAAARDAFLPIFEKACRVTEGHSQPLETLAVRPKLEELKVDWDTLQKALKAYKD